MSSAFSAATCSPLLQHGEAANRSALVNASADPTPDADGGAYPLWRTALTLRWLSLLAVVLAVAGVMITLGVWQYDVYESKTASATAQRATAPPVPLKTLFAVNEGLPAKAVGRRVSVSGTWGPAADQMFVADRQQDGRDGFWVITPLMLSPDSTESAESPDTPPTNPAADKASGAVLVVRGWVATPTDPAAAPPSGRVDVVGSVIASEAQDSSGAAANSRILPSLRIPTMVHLVDYQLYDAFVVQSSATPPVANGPITIPPPAPPTDHAGLRNVAYAVQWWIFAAFALFMWLRMLIDTHRTTRPTPGPSTTPPAAATPQTATIDSPPDATSDAHARSDADSAAVTPQPDRGARL
ncbi:SURF1 family protein [Kribbella sp. NBC_01245]|uniref:SURF1 family protein n=1 Tax=Kribbella sp. NBC_01245 TaxID=2903578 RepID=UPI002E280566|nr:SURF1 family protein [Kribbella sp. NBC_01245]